MFALIWVRQMGDFDSLSRVLGSKNIMFPVQKIAPFTMDKRRGSGPREYEFPSLNEGKLDLAEMYSLDTEIFEIS